MNIAKEATYSNQIEGTKTELDETLLELQEILPEDETIGKKFKTILMR